MLDHAALPSVRNARLPTNYETAKRALEQCDRIDECKDWADRMAALASYAKQSEDHTLRRTAERIQARAVQRCGQILKAIPAGVPPGKARSVGAPPLMSRAQAARDAGMSRDQKHTALRVASISKDMFEALVEAEEPPTVTALAERGTRKRTKAIDIIGDRDPADFKRATRLLGALRAFVALPAEIDLTSAVRGLDDRERRDAQQMLKQVDTILSQLRRKLS